MSLFRSAFARARFPTALSRRGMSTAEEVGTGNAGALVTAVGTTFVTYMTADFLSNFIQHPSQKV